MIRRSARASWALASSRLAAAVRTTAICSSGGGLLDVHAVDPELRLRLVEVPLRLGQRELQFPRVQPDQDLSRPDVLAHLDQDFTHDARDLAADPGAVGRDQGTREIDLPLHGDPLHRGHLHLDGRPPRAWCARRPRPPLALLAGSLTLGTPSRQQDE